MMDKDIKEINYRIPATIGLPFPRRSTPESTNTSIHTLYLLEKYMRKATIRWILAALKGLKVLHITRPLIDEVIPLLHEHSKALEGLVLTVPKASRRPHTRASGLSYRTTLKGFKCLTSLKIGSYMLLGYGVTTMVHKILPRSLMELEVCIDKNCSRPFIFSGWDEPGNNYWQALRPVSLFGLLGNKGKHTPKLQRVRITSEEVAWAKSYDDCIRPWRGDYVPYPGDWTTDGSAKSWKPPIELIETFREANVSFCVYINAIEPEYLPLYFRLIIPGGKWFYDNWEDRLAANRVEDLGPEYRDGDDGESSEGEGSVETANTAIMDEDETTESIELHGILGKIVQYHEFEVWVSERGIS